MRPDFNKLLTERERIGHGMKFHQVRGSKGNASFDEDAKGGKESIHARRRNSVKVNRKSFNENLNPLRNFLRVSVGRPWDKVYSDICKSFDKRKVVNNHILEHLFQYVEIEDVKVVDGKVYLHSPWRGLKPIKESHCEWYVDPRDGILKSGKRPPKVSLRKLREKQAEKEVAQVFKAIDRDTHLILDGGIWWIYEIKDIPPVVKVWGPQAHMAESIWRTLSK
jgi:hypothetical protein